MRYLIIVIALLGLVVLGGTVLFRGAQSLETYAEVSIKIHDAELSAWVADTEEKRRQGLSGTLGMPQDQGMLFVFEEPQKTGFWMKEMKYPIDIVWIYSDGQILDMKHHVTPESFPAVFESDSYAKYVLEVNAGWAGEHGLNVGDIVEIPKM